MNTIRSTKKWGIITVFVVSFSLILLTHIFLHPLHSVSQGSDNIQPFYRDNEYILGHINGLNTTRDSAAREVDLLSGPLDELRIETTWLWEKAG